MSGDVFTEAAHPGSCCVGDPLKASLGFGSLLFVGLMSFGVWFQQAYMNVYSQEFEAQRQEDRSQAILLAAKKVQVKEYVGSRLTVILAADEGKYYSNGRIAASGDLRYQSFRASGEEQFDVKTSKMYGSSKNISTGRSFLDSQNRLGELLFPNEVVALMGAETITGRYVIYRPEEGLVTSNEPVVWKGPKRFFRGGNFRYEMGPGNLEVGGPVQGNFIPSKEDFRGLKR